MSSHNVPGVIPYFDTTLRGDGPTLLLAHGAGGSVAGNFGPLLASLAATRRVVGPDYPGSGATPRATAALTLDALADGVVAATDDERFTVLGYSLGSAVAVRIATRYPDRVTGLILTAGFARPDHRLSLALQVWRKLLDSGNRTLVARYLTLLACGAKALQSMSASELDSAIEGLADFLPDGSADHVDVALQVDVTAELSAISVPALVIATTEDALVSPQSSAELAAGLPNSSLVEIDCGHNIATEATDAWLLTLHRWLERHG